MGGSLKAAKGRQPSGGVDEMPQGPGKVGRGGCAE